MGARVAEIAVLNRSRLDDEIAAFACAAVDIQARRDYLPLWPGFRYHPMRFYKTERDLPVVADLARLIVLSDTIDIPGVLGYHTMDPLIRGVVLAQGTDTIETLSHEAREMDTNPTCTQWRPMPDGRHVAYENADPVQRDRYPIEVEILGRRRTMFVSNFVTPQWFGERGDGSRRVDFMNLLAGPFTLRPGGYMIVREGSRVYDVSAQLDPMIRARKVLNSTSRSYRLGLR